MADVAWKQVSFTPLVSPAQTPMDNNFSMTDYGLADEFFSPLTSPAIEAQNAYSSTGTTASPVDLDDSNVPSKPTVAGTKRPRKKATGAARTPARSVKQSPAMKAQTRRRGPSLTSLPMDKIRNVLPQSANGATLLPSAPNSAGIQPGDESVSPEPLSEAAMRPPPVPQSGRSPQPVESVATTQGNGPVTPATLMRMPSNQSETTRMERLDAQLADEPMEDIMLPAAAAPTAVRPSHALVENGQGSTESTPTLSAKTAKINASSTPRSTIARNTSTENFAKPSKVENRGGRASKKRQSTSSATISPALRPKISPSISPLAPAPGKKNGSLLQPSLTDLGSGMSHLSAETSALYLASKSNYQNILEGTHLPGVSYPETLAENLTSKRTSHKIAEQGRRNRINLALKEIETLLPASILIANSKKEKALKEEDNDTEGVGGKTPAGGQGASKASTVEMAIVYIKSLQDQLQEAKQRQEAAEKQLADLRSRDGSADTQPTPEA
jgi:hypothetical protein